jgi:hypothetical protein
VGGGEETMDAGKGVLQGDRQETGVPDFITGWLSMIVADLGCILLNYAIHMVKKG